tara:strand:- start:292 stop:2127 length:1836 start_codon:yes stop_codon:yes gene_type:complete
LKVELYEMPQVFSPGEPETRPLDPTATTYTTAQKVADLLEIGPQEAVLMSANAEANAVFVTGSDFRNIGFSDTDKILIYSDADPMGKECTITGITSTAGGVKLTFSETINPGLYEVADNGYVQNQSSFTDGFGKKHGVTKSKVDAIILRMQDKIDNLTHNAWRPYLVSAEYINFDTYKPYRRRYYTDYVGTTPLLFRNVQQILRLELWQGDDYREIGSAEARLILPDNVRDLSGSIVLSPGNGSAATLTMNTGTGQWRADFDKATSAQNLADLINKENRVNKTAVEFSPAFTLEGSTANVAVHNEFLATANADYGTGQVKITSMRDTVGGESCTLVCTDNKIDIGQTSSSQATFSSLDGTTINVTSTLGTSSVVGFSNLSGGTGYSAANNVSVSGGGGSGLTVDTTVSAGVISSIVINSPGENYVVGDTITIPGGSGTATFTVTSVSDGSWADAGVALAANGKVFSYTGKTPTSFTGCTIVVGSHLNEISGKITQHQFQIDLQGGSSSGDKGRLRDWWLDHEMGIIYFNNSYPFFEWNAVKVAYIYGERYLEQAIEDACTKLVAIDLLMSDDRSVLIPEGSQNVDLASKIQLYNMDVEKTLARYKEVVIFG